MYFVRSGNINLTTGSLRNAGYYGFPWSSTAYPANSQYAFYLAFVSATAFPSSNYSRWYGFSLRCLARSTVESGE